MTNPSKFAYLTAEEYLAREARASTKNEYVGGSVFAMSGVTRRHNKIACNIYSLLRPHLRGGRCSAYVAGVKVHVQATNSFYYPDVMVSCDESDDKSAFTSCPVLIAEVLSKSTASIDRREKLVAYRQIESLQDYLIVHQRKKRIELHHRNADGAWEVSEFRSPEEPSFEVLNGSVADPLMLSVDAIYEDIDWSVGDHGLVSETEAAEWPDDEELEW